MKQGKGTITLTQEELVQLIQSIKQEQLNTYSYVNYASYPVFVGDKVFEPNGIYGCERNDITDADLMIIKKAKLIDEGILGEKSDSPNDGSYSDQKIIDLCNLEYELFEINISKIFGIITLERIIKALTKLEKPSKFEKLCLNRIQEILQMKSEKQISVTNEIVV